MAGIKIKFTFVFVVRLYYNNGTLKTMLGLCLINCNYARLCSLITLPRGWHSNISCTLVFILGQSVDL